MLEGKRKHAVCTLASAGRGYLKGALVNCYAARLHSPNMQTVILLERSKYNSRQIEYCQSTGCLVKEVDPLRPSTTHFKSRRWPQTFTKLQAWSLIEFDRLLFLDADACPFADISHLFDHHNCDLAAAGIRSGQHRFDSGVMLLRPDMGIYKGLLKLLNGESRNDAHLGDQGLLNIYFHRNHQTLPARYNRRMGWKGNSTIIAHLQCKPWHRKGRGPIRQFTELWRKYLAELTNKFGSIP